MVTKILIVVFCVAVIVVGVIGVVQMVRGDRKQGSQK